MSVERKGRAGERGIRRVEHGASRFDIRTDDELKLRQHRITAKNQAGADIDYVRYLSGNTF